MFSKTKNRKILILLSLFFSLIYIYIYADSVSFSKSNFNNVSVTKGYGNPQRILRRLRYPYEKTVEISLGKLGVGSSIETKSFNFHFNITDDPRPSTACVIDIFGDGVLSQESRDISHNKGGGTFVNEKRITHRASKEGNFRARMTITHFAEGDYDSYNIPSDIMNEGVQVCFEGDGFSYNKHELGLDYTVNITKVSSNSDEIRRLNNLINELRRLISEKDTLIKNLQKQIQNLTQQKVDLENQIKSISQTLFGNETKNTTEINEKINQLKQDLANSEQKLDELKVKIQLLKQTLEQIGLENLPEVDSIENQKQIIEKSIETLVSLRQKELELNSIKEKIKILKLDPNTPIEDLLQNLKEKSDTLKEIEDLLNNNSELDSKDTSPEKLQELLKKYQSILNELEVDTSEKAIQRIQELEDIENKYKLVLNQLKNPTDLTNRINELLEKENSLNNIYKKMKELNLSEENENSVLQALQNLKEGIDERDALRILTEKLKLKQAELEDLIKNLQKDKENLTNKLNKALEKLNSTNDNLDLTNRTLNQTQERLKNTTDELNLKSKDLESTEKTLRLIGDKLNEQIKINSELLSKIKELEERLKSKEKESSNPTEFLNSSSNQDEKEKFILNKSKEYGLIDLLKDGLDGDISREESMKLIHKVSVIRNNKNIRDYNNNFKDISNENKSFRYITELFDKGLIDGTSNTTFSSNTKLTKNMLSKVGLRMFHLDSPNFKYKDSKRLAERFGLVNKTQEDGEQSISKMEMLETLVKWVNMK